MKRHQRILFITYFFQVIFKCVLSLSCRIFRQFLNAAGEIDCTQFNYEQFLLEKRFFVLLKRIWHVRHTMRELTLMRGNPLKVISIAHRGSRETEYNRIPSKNEALFLGDSSVADCSQSTDLRGKLQCLYSLYSLFFV